MPMEGGEPYLDKTIQATAYFYDVANVGLKKDVTVKSVRKPRTFPTGKLGMDRAVRRGCV